MTPAVEDLNHAELRVRIQTMQDFIQAGAAALPVLLTAFEHPELEVRWRAAATAGWIGGAEAINALVNLSRGAVYEIKFNCMWALGQSGSTHVVPELLAILHADDDELPDIRYNAALALLRLGEKAALQAALQDALHPAHRVAHAALGAAPFLT